jgi:LysR family transcriptional regulator for metE and metH
MEIGSNETIKQAVMAGLGIAFISAHTIAAEIWDGRLTILDFVGLPDIRQWFVVRPAAKRMMPAARALHDFLVAEGRHFLPNIKQPPTKGPGTSGGSLARKRR